MSVLDRSVRREVIDRLERLVENFGGIIPLPLHGQWKGFFKLRVGDWRVVYKFDSSKKIVRVEIIDRRSRIYKKGT